MYISIPLSLQKNERGATAAGVTRIGDVVFARSIDVADSIRSFIELLVNTPLGSYSPDSEFGFVFKNFRFQIFNEEKGVLYSSDPDNEISDYYKYKIQGHGVNFNTFAHELKMSIEKYEPRLKRVRVNMEYSSTSKNIDIVVTGKINDKISEDFEHIIKMHVW